MDMTGERRIAAPRQAVWDALNDPAVLQASIPGCQALDRQSDNTMTATAAVKVGPISARFSGKVELSDIDPPNGYTISGEGQGGVAGFAKGGAKVKLDDDAGATVLRYEVHAQVGGKLAQLGARLIDASAKQIADQFFDRFSAQVAQTAAATTATATTTAPTAPVAGATVAGAVPSSSPTASSAATPPVAAANRPPITAAAPILTPPAFQTAAPSASPIPARPAPPPSVSLFALVPPEPFGLPLAAWIGGAVYLLMLLLIFGSML